MLKGQNIFEDECASVVVLKREIYDQIGRNYHNNNLDIIKFLFQVKIILQEKAFDPMARRVKKKPENCNNTKWRKYLKAFELAKKQAEIIYKIGIRNVKEWGEKINFTGWRLEEVYFHIMETISIEAVYKPIRVAEEAFKELQDANGENNSLDLETYFRDTFIRDEVEILEQTKQALYNLVRKCHSQDYLNIKSFFEEVESVLDDEIYSILFDQFKNLKEDHLEIDHKLMKQVQLKEKLLKNAKDAFKIKCKSLIQFWPADERFINWSLQDIYRYIMSIIDIEDLFDVVRFTDGFLAKILADSLKKPNDEENKEIQSEDIFHVEETTEDQEDDKNRSLEKFHKFQDSPKTYMDKWQNAFLINILPNKNVLFTILLGLMFYVILNIIFY